VVSNGSAQVAGGQEKLLVVYVVDDDDAVRGGIARVLRSAGVTVRAFESAARFLDEVEQAENACILLDLTMDGITGSQAQETLNERGISLPVITVSARDDFDTRQRAKSLGAKMFLRKPVDDQALLDAINWVLNPRQGV
jgi:FixJ family two-component response regulator